MNEPRPVPAPAGDPEPRPLGRLYIRVLAVQGAALVILWLLQACYGQT